MATDPDEFLEFATARSKQLFRTAWLLCGDWHLAEDLVQITLGKLFRSWRRVGAADSPDAYARTVLVRSYLSYRRRRSSTERPYGNLPDSAGREIDPALRLTLLNGLADRPRSKATPSCAGTTPTLPDGGTTEDNHSPNASA